MDILLAKDYFRQKLPVPNLPRAKSIVIRYMVYHYIKTGNLLPLLPDDPQDIKTVHQALTLILQNKDVKILCIIDVKDCGAAFRFLLPLLAATQGRWLLTGTPRLLARPITPLISSLQNMGAQIARHPNGSLSIQGTKINAPVASIDCEQSSQFASALLLSSKLLGIEKLTITPDCPPSESYIRMTKEVMTQYDRSGLPETFENDWSAAAFWYAWAYLNDFDTLILPNLSLNSIQGDAVTAQWFTDLGVISMQIGDSIHLTRGGAKARRREDAQGEGDVLPKVKFHLSQNIDLAPLMIVLAAIDDRIETITGIENLNLKESNRRDELLASLSIFYDLQYENSCLIKIKKRANLPEIHNLTFDARQDHRLVMAYALLSSFYSVRVVGAEAVEKSYPVFF
ncbi:MAG: hypothetical protein LBV46_03215 [Bacteroidales bacterium]|jgi:3-phosphoshikimate 1-carboxyvinyltransferase|nr:hypothetical protein [Bacteroidales bacterium]